MIWRSNMLTLGETRFLWISPPTIQFTPVLKVRHLNLSRNDTRESKAMLASTTSLAGKRFLTQHRHTQARDSLAPCFRFRCGTPQATATQHPGVSLFCCRCYLLMPMREAILRNWLRAAFSKAPRNTIWMIEFRNHWEEIAAKGAICLQHGILPNSTSKCFISILCTLKIFRGYTWQALATCKWLCSHRYSWFWFVCWWFAPCITPPIPGNQVRQWVRVDQALFCMVPLAHPKVNIFPVEFPQKCFSKSRIVLTIL